MTLHCYKNMSFKTHGLVWEDGSVYKILEDKDGTQ